MATNLTIGMTKDEAAKRGYITPDGKKFKDRREDWHNDKVLEGARLEFQRDMMLVVIMRAKDNPDKKIGLDELKGMLNQLTDSYRQLVATR